MEKEKHMNKLNFINYVLDNNYEFYENKDEININKIIDELNNVIETITYDKKTGEIQVFWENNGSGKSVTLSDFESKCIQYLSSIKVKGDNK